MKASLDKQYYMKDDYTS